MIHLTWPFTTVDILRLGIIASAGALGTLVGLVLDRRNTLQRYRRAGDPTPRRRRPGILPAALGMVWCLVSTHLPPPHDMQAVVVLAVHLLASTLVLIACGVDAAVHRLPDALTLPAAALTLLSAVVGLLAGDAGTAAASGRALVAATLAPVVALALTVTIGGLGLGDVKLLCSVAGVLAWHGWTHLLAAAVLSWLSAGVFAVTLLLRGRADRSTAIPLGPFLGGSALIALML